MDTPEKTPSPVYALTVPEILALGAIRADVTTIKEYMTEMKGKTAEHDKRIDAIEKDKAEAVGYRRALHIVWTLFVGAVSFIAGQR